MFYLCFCYNAHRACCRKYETLPSWVTLFSVTPLALTDMTILTVVLTQGTM
jgi:hypothetical protein